MALALGLLATSASVGSPAPASADMMGKFSVPLMGQGMYAGGEISGHAIGSLDEGIVLVHAIGLPPTEGERSYVGWLVNSMTGEKFNTGILKPVGPGGAYSGAYTSGMALPGSGYTMFAVTIEPNMNMSNDPAGDIIIAGNL